MLKIVLNYGTQAPNPLKAPRCVVTRHNAGRVIYTMLTFQPKTKERVHAIETTQPAAV